jgi:hypothetical protein
MHIHPHHKCQIRYEAYATISLWVATVPDLGAPQTSVFYKLAPTVQDRLSPPQFGHQT